MFNKLKGVSKINNKFISEITELPNGKFKITYDKNKPCHIMVNHSEKSITFFMESEENKNGCTPDDLIEVANFLLGVKNIIN